MDSVLSTVQLNHLYSAYLYSHISKSVLKSSSIQIFPFLSSTNSFTEKLYFLNKAYFSNACCHPSFSSLSPPIPISNKPLVNGYTNGVPVYWLDSTTKAKSCISYPSSCLPTTSSSL